MRKAAAVAGGFSSFYRSLQKDGMVNFNFDEVLIVYPTVFNFPFELNKENSCSFQLTNKTDGIVAYTWHRLGGGLLVSPDQDTYVGTILPWSTSSVTLTVTLKRGKEPPPEHKEWIGIWAHVVKDGVKAEDITRANLFDKTKLTNGSSSLLVVYDYTVPSADNSSSAVPEKNEKGISLILDDDDDDDDDNRLLCQSISDEVHETTSEGKGSESSFRRQSYNEMSNIVLFSDDEIKCATNGFSDSLKIGQGGYGSVYKGNLRDNEVAIKMSDPSSQQGMTEFLQEIEVLGRMRHPNLVNLIGACIKLRALIYEFLPYGSVEDYLKKDSRILTWQMRTRIVYDICSALTFLHSIKPEPVVHGDLKPANILLDANFISKLADFGLSRFLPGGTASVAFLDTSNIQGTEWYIDPDFLETGKLTSSCDVYSFGITMLRILTRAPAARVDRKVERAIRNKSLMAMVDSTAGDWPENVAEYLACMGLECCEPERKSSKLMKDILTGLDDILAKIDT